MVEPVLQQVALLFTVRKLLPPVGVTAGLAARHALGHAGQLPGAVQGGTLESAAPPCMAILWRTSCDTVLPSHV